MSGKASNIPMWIITRVTAFAINCLLAYLAFEFAIKAIAWLGYVPSYEDTPGFYKKVGLLICIPTFSYVIYWTHEFKYELEEKRLQIDLQPVRIEPLLTQRIDNSLASLPRNGGSGLIKDI